MFFRFYKPSASFKRKLCKFLSASLKIEETRELSPTSRFPSGSSFLWMNEWSPAIGSQDDDVSRARHQRNASLFVNVLVACVKNDVARQIQVFSEPKFFIVILGIFFQLFDRNVIAKWFGRKSLLITETASRHRAVRRLSSDWCVGNGCACSVGTIKQSPTDVLGFSSVWKLIRLRSDLRTS